VGEKFLPLNFFKKEGCLILRSSITITGAPEEIGHEDEAKMDAGRSCVGAKGERVRWAPPVGAVF
jgi:hypothetical protein